MKFLIDKTWSQNFRTILSKELRDVLRDRRAAFFTFIFPLLFYPLLYVGVQKFKEYSRANLIHRDVRIAICGQGEEFLKVIEKSDAIDVGFGVPFEDGFLEREEFDALLRFEPAADASRPIEITLRYDGAKPISREAGRRAAELVDRYRLQRIAARFAERSAPADPRRMLVLKPLDVASSQNRGEAFLGRILPSVFLLLFFTGGAFAAIDMVAGEKERGTLETLLVHPISGSCLAAAKFSVILICSLGAAILNLAGMFLAQKLLVQAGSGMLPELALPSWKLTGVVLILILPLAIFSSAILMALSSYSRSFRECQTLLIPAMLAGLLPASIAAFPNVELNPMTACIPVGNIALAIRETIDGELKIFPVTVAFVFTALIALLALRWSIGLLGREEFVLGLDRPVATPDSRQSQRFSRALCFAVVMLLILYYGATVLQSPDGRFGPFWGLGLTLWGLVLAPALLYLLMFRLPVREALALRRPGIIDTSLSLALVPVAILLLTAFMRLQDQWLPFPEGLENSLRGSLNIKALHPLASLFLFAVSPAICEEVLWRGVFQGEVEGEKRRWRTIALVGFFFGLFHLSIYRLMPTGLLGGWLAYLRWRTGSIFPGMLFHCAYNAMVLLVLAPLVESNEPELEAFFHPAVLAAAAGLFFLIARRIGRPAAELPRVSLAGAA